jgi:ATP synthase in type III secretion protein N
MEDEDTADPLAEEVRSLLDGHIVLSRALAEKAHYPSIAIDQSLSRIANRIVEKEHLQSAANFRRLLAKQKELDLLVKLGEYTEGKDADSDLAISVQSQMMEFLQQDVNASVPWQESVDSLAECIRG